MNFTQPLCPKCYLITHSPLKKDENNRQNTCNRQENKQCSPLSSLYSPDPQPLGCRRVLVQRLHWKPLTALTGFLFIWANHTGKVDKQKSDWASRVLLSNDFPRPLHTQRTEAPGRPGFPPSDMASPVRSICTLLRFSTSALPSFTKPLLGPCSHYRKQTSRLKQKGHMTVDEDIYRKVLLNIYLKNHHIFSLIS